MKFSAQEITALAALASALIGPIVAYFIAKRGIQKNTQIDRLKIYDSELRQSMKNFMMNIAEVSKDIQRGNQTDKALSNALADRAMIVSFIDINNSSEQGLFELVDKLLYIFNGKSEIDHKAVDKLYIDIPQKVNAILSEKWAALNKNK